jgi:hypothetical protein
MCRGYERFLFPAPCSLQDVLSGICTAGRVTPEEKKALREFRQRHGIRPGEVRRS